MTDCLVYAGTHRGGVHLAGGHPVHRRRRVARRFAAHRRDAADHGAVRPLAVHHGVRHRGVLRAATAKRHRQDRLHPARLHRRGDHARLVERLVAAQHGGLLPRLPVVDGADLRAGDLARRRRAAAGSSASLPPSCPAWCRPAWSRPTRRPGWARSATGSWPSARRRFGGKPAGKAVKNFADQVVELAFVHDRIDRGFGDQRVFALQKRRRTGSMRRGPPRERCICWPGTAAPGSPP